MAIRVAPDYRLIEVVMDIEFEGNLSEEMVAQLTSAGITGITFIELDRRKKGEADMSPKIDFVAEYPIIPSRPSELTRIMTTIDRVMQGLNKIDFAGMGKKVEETLDSIHSLAADQRLQSAMDNLTEATKAVKDLTVRLDKAINKAAVDDLVDSARETLHGLKQAVAQSRKAITAAEKLLADVNHEVQSMKLPEVTAQAGALFQSLEARSVQLGNQAQDLASQVHIILRNLGQSTATLMQLLKRLENDPSSIIFSEPAAPRPGRSAEGK